MVRNKAIIFDIDGTLADISHRLHYIQSKKKDYKSFYEACVNDLPKNNVIKLYQYLDLLTSYCDWPSPDLFFCTGRPAEYKEQTLSWLNEHVTDFVENLIMRPSNDYRADYIVKEEMLHEIQKTHDVIFTIDDRQQVVDMWRRNGITCFQVEQWSEGSKPLCEPGKFTMLVGPSGAGKTFYCFYNEALTGEIISSDETRQHITGSVMDQTQNNRVWSYIHDRVVANIKHGLDTILDSTMLRNRDRKKLLDLLPPNTPIKYIVINRPLADKLAERGWRSDELVRRHDQIFKSNLSAILAGDNDPRVTVEDRRM